MNEKSFADVPVTWKPTERNGKRIKEFTKRVQDKYRVTLDGYWDLLKWSIENISEFWEEFWDFSGIIHSKRFYKVIDLDVPMSESPKWFQGARLNLAENLLRYRDDKVALILPGEDRETEKVTYAQMYKEAEKYAAAFRKFGLKQGDVVVCQMPNRKEAVFAMLAVNSIGAIWTGALPLLGPEATLSRFTQVQPRVYLTIDRFPHQGKDVDMFPNVKEITRGLRSLDKVVIVASKPDSTSKDISEIPNSCFLHEFLELGRQTDGSIPEMKFEQVSFSHPSFINYTSGTTGLPKTLVHGCGGLITSIRDWELHCDITRDSTFLSASPVGWATWNAFCNVLYSGCSLLLYEGVPYFLSPTYFWNLMEEHNLTHVFLPTSIIDEFQKRDYIPNRNLDSLEAIMCGGSIVKPQSYDFVHEKIKKDMIFSSCFGTTEMIGCCMIFDTTIPIHKGEIPTPSLGVAIETVDQNGSPVVGEIGNLVVAKPVPSLPLGLWKDEDGSMYRNKYFSIFSDKFDMGDYAIINPITHGINICCRSDETLKQRGYRFGSSEIYSIVDKFAEIRDSICVSQYNKDLDERAVLFLKMRDGHVFSEQLVRNIREAITEELTDGHVPDVILEVGAIPYNMNGKKMEIVVKGIINGRPYNADTIRNPESLKNFFDNPGLGQF